MTPAFQEYKRQILEVFECQGTGNCCRAPGWVYASPSEIRKMAETLNLSEPAFRDKYTQAADGWTLIAAKEFRPDCFLDDQNRCQIYEARPRQCKTYPDWPEIWENETVFNAELRLCKGLRIAAEKVMGL